MALYKSLLSILGILLSLPALALTDYDADYHISVRGVPAGTMVYEARFKDDDYSVIATSKPSLAAKMLGFSIIREKVTGKIIDGTVFPSLYQRDMTDKRKFHLLYKYLPDIHTVNAEVGDKMNLNLHYIAGENPLDTLSMVTQSLLDLSKGKFAESYTLVSDDHIRTYQVKPLPEKKWETKAGEVVTVKTFSQTHGNRETRVYFALDPLRLVKLEQYKNGSSTFVITLLSFQELP